MATVRVVVISIISFKEDNTNEVTALPLTSAALVAATARVQISP